MKSRLREVGAAALVMLGVGALAGSVLKLQEHDFVSSIVLCVMGLALLGAGLEAVRPVMGE